MAKSRNAATGRRGGGVTKEDKAVGFAKLLGEDFEFYMQTYSIVLGRGSKSSDVDFDLGAIGGGTCISRLHARIFYDFPRRCFALEVLGRNGCLVEGVLHEPGSEPVKLESRDLIQMGDKKFYFLLPSRSVFGADGPSPCHPRPALRPRPRDYANGVLDNGNDEDEELDGEEKTRPAAIDNSGKRQRRDYGDVHVGSFGNEENEAAPVIHSVRKPNTRSRANREADDQLLLQLEEKDVTSCVATFLSNLCGPGEQFPMEKLHAKLFEIYGDLWHHSRVRRYLTSEDYPKSETKGRPWFGLLMLLRKYPEHFAIRTRSKGKECSYQICPRTRYCFYCIAENGEFKFKLLRNGHGSTH